MTVRSAFRLAAVIAAVSAGCRGAPQRPPPPVAVLVPPPLSSDAVRRAVEARWDARLLRFYSARAFRPAWVDGPGRVARALDALDVVAGAAQDGLDARRYELPDARERFARTAHPDSLAALDVRLSELVTAYAYDLSLGRVDAPALDSLWRPANAFDPIPVIVAAVDSGLVRGLAERLRPPHAGYAALRRALDGGGSASRLAVNLERWRWLPRDLGRRYIMVNLAAFEAVAVEHGAPVLRSLVVAGRPDWPTPIVSGMLGAVTANPPWNVPREIALREILPAIRADTGFLRREQMAVYRGSRLLDPASVDWAAVRDTAFPFRLVQAPGPRNPLGRVKLTFANPFNVALHDTPGRSVFAQADRAASHGCVRLERALELARWALDPAGRGGLDEALSRGDEHALRVGDSVTVHLVYWTAWVDEGGALQVREDVYGWDARLVQALAAGTTPRRV